MLVVALCSGGGPEHDQDYDSNYRNESNQDPPAGAVNVVQSTHGQAKVGEYEGETPNQVKDSNETAESAVPQSSLNNGENDGDNDCEQVEVPECGSSRPTAEYRVVLEC